MRAKAEYDSIKFSSTQSAVASAKSFIFFVLKIIIGSLYSEGRALKEKGQ